MGAKKKSVLERVNGIVAGLQAAGSLPSGFLFYSEEASYTGPAMLTKLTGLQSPMSQVATAKSALDDAETAAAAAEVVAKPILADAEKALRAWFGTDAAKLALYGLAEPKVRAPMTTEQKLQMGLKAKATRKLRGTLSPKQKKALTATSVPPTTITVDDTGVSVVPASAPATPTR